jgi:hypothetical protein
VASAGDEGVAFAVREEVRNLNEPKPRISLRLRAHIVITLHRQFDPGGSPVTAASGARRLWTDSAQDRNAPQAAGDISMVESGAS